MIDDRPGADFGAGLRQIGMVVDLLRLSAEEAVDEIAPLLHPEMRMLAWRSRPRRSSRHEVSLGRPRAPG